MCKPLVITAEIGRQLDQQRAEPAAFLQRGQSVQQDPHELITIRLEPGTMGDLPVNFWCKGEVISSQRNPFSYRFFGREAIPDAVQFNGVIASGVVAEKL